MTHKILLTITAISLALAMAAASAGETDAVEDEHIVIALSTDDFELAETDISDMEVGDAQTFNTESGKRIDLLRTEDGVEIYMDGELIETGLHGEHDLHEGHKVVHKEVEVICNTDEDCEHVVWISEDEELDVEALHHDGSHEKIIIIKKEVDTD